MYVKRIICCIVMFSIVFILVGCQSEGKDDFIDFDKSQPLITEDVVMETEFREYDGKTERIYVTLLNNRDKDFLHSKRFFLQKLDGNEWHYINVGGFFELVGCAAPPHWEGTRVFDLKDHVKLPLRPGTYRIGYVKDNDEGTPVAEFTVK